MGMQPSSPVTGGAQIGFTSPTYTLLQDSNPSGNSRRWIVSAVGGTQAGVTANTASQQFAIEVEKPVAIKQLGAPGLNGQVAVVPLNKYKVTVLKSVTPGANQLPRMAIGRFEISVPAGSETYDAANVKACISLLVGALTQLSAGIGDTVITGVL